MGKIRATGDLAQVELVKLPPAETPADWLAWDEALLEAAEVKGGPSEGVEKIWFWESESFFIVLGYGQKIESEVFVSDCERLQIPILRRCSGGGTVVQGRGCLNYGLILKIPEGGPLTTISGTNHWVMERHRQALSAAIGASVWIRGYTDLAISRSGQELKFSGNAQRRKRQTLLFHGTVLLNFDLSLIPRVLRPPSWAPDYRANRGHLEFVTNTGLTSDQVRRALTSAWGATQRQSSLPRDRAEISNLVAARYARPEWHRRL